MQRRLPNGPVGCTTRRRSEWKLLTTTHTRERETHVNRVAKRTKPQRLTKGKQRHHQRRHLRETSALTLQTFQRHSVSATLSGGGRRSREVTAAVGCGGDFVSASEWRSTAQETEEDGAAGGGGEQRRTEAAEEGASPSSKREERRTIVSAQRRRQTTKKANLRRRCESSHLQTVWSRRLSASAAPSLSSPSPSSSSTSSSASATATPASVSSTSSASATSADDPPTPGMKTRCVRVSGRGSSAVCFVYFSSVGRRRDRQHGVTPC